MSSYTKKKLISAVAPLLSNIGVCKLFAPAYAGLGHILTFHRVIKPQNKQRIHNHLSLEISPEQLENTIAFYKSQKYDFISLDEVYQRLHSSKRLSKFVAFTFDDGYRDNYTIAYPILKKHQIPFTIYITTNFPNHKAVLWWYFLEEEILKNDSIDFEWQAKHYHFDCSSIINKEASFDHIKNLITRSFQIEDHEDLLSVIFKKEKTALYSHVKALALSWQEIKTISQDPLCTIGAHTVNHYPLSQLTTEQVISEINESRELIELYTGKAVEHFAYPFGKIEQASLREFDAVKALKFKTGTTTRIGNIFKAHRHKTECLPRISINSITDTSVLRLQSSGLLPFIIHRGRKVVTN